MIGDYELITKGAYFYDPCSRVPMILRLPAAERAGTRVGELVQPHDLAATLLRAAGMPAPEVAALMPESQDLAALARAEVAAPRDHALTLYRNSGYGNRGYWDPPIYGTMFHDGRYKLSLFHDPDARRDPEGELYDMEADPGETTNLWSAPEHAARRAHLTDAPARHPDNQRRCTTSPAAAAQAGPRPRADAACAGSRRGASPRRWRRGWRGRSATSCAEPATMLV